MTMNCENWLCIYEEKGKCILKNISIDSCGQCNECIYINLEEEKLQEIKNAQREYLNIK